MTRYIDADLLMKKKIHHYALDYDYVTTDDIDDIPTADVVEVTDKSMESLIKGLEILGDTKDRADVVEVVWCKDCVYREIRRDPLRTTMDCFGCEIMHYNDDDWYCSFGKRRE